MSNGKRRFEMTDTGNAERFVAKFGQDYVYCNALGGWKRWDGMRWLNANDSGFALDSITTVRSILQDALMVEDSNERKRLADHAFRSESAFRMSALELMARPLLAKPVELFNNNPWLLNCANGTIDLRTGALQPALRSDYNTRLTPVKFDPAAKCPQFEQFISDAMGGNLELVTFIQRAVGYTLTDSVKEQVLFFLHGLGANGKSTFMSVIQALLGDYSVPATPTLLLQQRYMSHPTEQAMLHGRRMVVCQEVDAGHKFAEVTVKQLTGGDKICARFMYREFFDFDPVHKIWLCANHKPIVRGTDDAIWRRILLVPFTVTVPPEKRDTHLVEKLKAELPGVLNWAIKGCLDWQQQGLAVATTVRAASALYRHEQDFVGSFIAQCCVLGVNNCIRAKDLYTAFRQWCKEQNEECPSQTAFGLILADRPGLRRTLTCGRTKWHGIELSPDLEQV